MLLDAPIESLPRTSPVTIKKFKALDINTFWDLLNYFPFRYGDYSLISPISKLQTGEIVTVQGKIVDSTQIRARGLRIQKFQIEDNTGKIEISWFNQPFLLTVLKKGLSVSIAGEVKKFGNKYSLEPIGYEILRGGTPSIHTARVVPIYPEKLGLSSRTIREKVFHLINNLSWRKEDFEFLPGELVREKILIDELEAYKITHFPQNINAAFTARRRLAFDELFFIQLSVEIIRRKWEKETVTNSFEIRQHRAALDTFIKSLPFTLTSSQAKAAEDISIDLEKTKPMNRFLQGDVGSGKTVVAAIAIYLAYLNGYQSLVMAPTEILASQHHKTISSFLSAFGLKIELITGSSKKSPDHLDVAIGTHALFEKKHRFEKVGLVIIDEQHRFGVTQRAKLKEKGINPHLLTMTATPIPRTITLTLYSELDASYITEMPHGRLPIKTYLVPKIKRPNAYEWIKKKIKEERSQVFIVCPLIEESEHETLKSIKAASKEFEFLRDKIFSEFKLALVHGKLKSQLKNEVMTDFKKGKYDVLVATSVVEVGVDIPNAQIMLIEAAERYGLAQLHQLRGRVGRSNKQSYCLLFTEKQEPAVLNRLKFFTSNLNGLKLAEYDLSRRGPGELYGVRQHGIPDLKIASFTDIPLINSAKDVAAQILDKYKITKLPILQKRMKSYQSENISRD